LKKDYPFHAPSGTFCRRFTQMIADQKDILPRINANEHESKPEHAPEHFVRFLCLTSLFCLPSSWLDNFTPAAQEYCGTVHGTRISVFHLLISIHSCLFTLI